MLGWENRGETLIAMPRHFYETMTILIYVVFGCGALKILTGDYFVLRINKIIYFKQKLDVLFVLVFSQHFSFSSFRHSLCTVWRTNGVWIELHPSKSVLNFPPLTVDTLYFYFYSIIIALTRVNSSDTLLASFFKGTRFDENV